MMPRMRFCRTDTFFNVTPSSCKKAPRKGVSHVGRSSCAFITGFPLIWTFCSFSVASRVNQTCSIVGMGMPGFLRRIPTNSPVSENTFTNCWGRRVMMTSMLPSETVKNTVSRSVCCSTALFIMALTSRKPSTVAVNCIVWSRLCKILDKIPNSSGKLISGVPESPTILVFLASMKSL